MDRQLNVPMSSNCFKDIRHLTDKPNRNQNESNPNRVKNPRETSISLNY